MFPCYIFFSQIFTRLTILYVLFFNISTCICICTVKFCDFNHSDLSSFSFYISYVCFHFTFWFIFDSFTNILVYKYPERAASTWFFHHFHEYFPSIQSFFVLINVDSPLLLSLQRLAFVYFSNDRHLFSF